MKRFRVVVGPVDNKRIYLITSPSEEAVRRDLRDVLSVEEELPEAQLEVQRQAQKH